MRTSRDPVRARYDAHYTHPGFERRGLFRLLRACVPGRDVLYPGCSIHLTPAFFFPRVVFIDQRPLARRFFADTDGVLSLVRAERAYRENPSIEFIAEDYTRPLPLLPDRFDLLLALFAPGVCAACLRYLRPGGLVLAHGPMPDVKEAMDRGELKLLEAIVFRGGRYQLTEIDPDSDTACATRKRRYLRRVNHGAEYIEDERYLLLARRGKTRARP